MYGNKNSLNTLDKVIKFSKSKEIKKGRLIYCPPYTLLNLFYKIVYMFPSGQRG